MSDASESARTHPEPGLPKFKTADPELMRAINRFHVLDTVRQHGPISRVEIAARSDLSRATISAITGALIDENLIHARHVKIANGGPRGRPRVMLELNPAATYVVGVKLAAHQISIAVTDFKADVVHSVTLPIRTARQSIGVVADVIEDGVRRCVGNAGLPMHEISGIGIGLPGIIESPAGLCHQTPILGDGPTAFAQLMVDRLDIPVMLENDASLVALAEHWFGDGRGVDTFAVVTVEQTVSLGLMLGGELYRGANGIGPVFAHIKMDPSGRRCACGRQGCLDAYASEAAIHSQARRVDLDGPIDDLPTPATMRRIAELARQGNADLRRIYESAGSKLGTATAMLINTLSPAKVILSGEGLQAADLMKDAILQGIEDDVAAAPRRTEIVFREWDDEVWARGAACLVLRKLYEAPLAANRPNVASEERVAWSR